MVGRRSLNITLFERFAVPNSVTLVNGDVVHVNRNPHIAGGIGDFVVNVVVDNKVVALSITILNVIDTGSVNLREIKLYIIILEICAYMG